MQSESAYQLVDDAIRQRKTTKVLADVELPTTDMRGVVEELIEVAGWAPFHRQCESRHQSQQLNGIVPWRMYCIDAQGCRQLRRALPSENAGKLPAMLAAADVVIQVTWLPNSPSSEFQPSPDHLFEPTLANMEHIAAASAAIQNLLVAATARGISTYWSSGGALLRDEERFRLLGIGQNEILLGSLFLFPQAVEQAQVVGSKLREQRRRPDSWARWVQLAIFLLGLLFMPAARAELTETANQDWLPGLDVHIRQLEADSRTLTEERQQLLSRAAVDIAQDYRQSQSTRLNFICTHNSRRSHLGQVWAAIAAHAYHLNINCFSGGTEATACNARIVRSLRRAGMSVVTKNPDAANPEYWLQFAETEPPITLFSKRYDHPTNPRQRFFAMMCCDDADRNCPIVPGTVGRVALHYQDPKESDGTDRERETYDARRDEIGAEMFFLMRELAERIKQ